MTEILAVSIKVALKEPVKKAVIFLKKSERKLWLEDES
jgi:hypothetical protein